MARNQLLQHLGTIYSKATTAMTTSYTVGATQYTGQATNLILNGSIVLAAASSVTGYKVQVMICDQNGIGTPAVITQNDTSGTTNNEQTIAVTANTTTYFAIATDWISAAAHGWYVQAKAVGAAGTTAESITITANVS